MAKQRSSEAGPKGRRVKTPLEECSPNDQASGGDDPEDYHGDGPIPIGHAPVHEERPQQPGIPIGIQQPAVTQKKRVKTRSR